MKLTIANLLIITILISLFIPASADDEVELETTFIKGNKELPQVLYIVPWKVIKEEKKKGKTLVLHSLFGNAFDPVTPEGLSQ